jgi:hypothetical protein
MIKKILLRRLAENKRKGEEVLNSKERPGKGIDGLPTILRKKLII